MNRIDNVVMEFEKPIIEAISESKDPKQIDCLAHELYGATRLLEMMGWIQPESGKELRSKEKELVKLCKKALKRGNEYRHTKCVP